jgi:hypothetical protein
VEQSKKDNELSMVAKVHPIRWVELRIWSKKHRNLRCENYESCLNYAARHWWGGFSCSMCPKNETKEDEKDD